MATTTTLLCAPQRVKRETALNENVDDNLLTASILTAQERFVHATLGTELYERLLTMVADGTIGEAGVADYKFLLDAYVVPMLVRFSFVEVLPVLRLRFVHSSVVSMGTEQGTPATYDDLKPVMKSSEQVGDWYRERLIDYLCHNSTLFPEYRDNRGADYSPTVRNYTGGFNVGTGRSAKLDKLARGILGLQ